MNKVVTGIGLLLLVNITNVVFAQQKGVRFEVGSRLTQILDKAKSENKIVFMDCYATWCGPCKNMDLSVYTNDTVATFFNDHFISVKVQMDTNRSDNQEIKNWYADSHEIMNRYQIKAYPTFLFFSAEGKIIHRSIGGKSAAEFIALGKEALNPNRQYYTMLEEYRLGRKDVSTMPYLIHTAYSLNDETTASVILTDYLNNHLYKLDKKRLFTKYNIEFVVSVIPNIAQTMTSEDRIFKWFLKDGEKIDALVGQVGYSQKVVDFEIKKEDIDTKLWADHKMVAEEPNWFQMESILSEKYGKSNADRNVLAAKILWYQGKKDWSDFINNKLKWIKQYDKDSSDFELDLNAWSIFQYSNDSSSLRTAITWIEIVLNRSPEWANALDTYANLLYKLGQIRECKIVEEKAVKLAPNDNEIRDNLAKMENGQPTWSDK